MFEASRAQYVELLESIRSAGTWKGERVLSSPQGATIRAASPGGGEREVLNFCANNYLGLANHPELVKAAKAALDRWGFGLSSVRFICGTQGVHKQLEAAVARFLGFDDAILYSSCFDANGGLFETLLDDQCAIISDELNHASIIDGIRLCKATRLRYKHMDMADLEAKLKEAAGARRRMVATDGVFSMDGDIAPLGAICDLAELHGAMVMVDDSHATGFIGDGGRGSIEHCGVMGRIDVVTSTLGKALGGASGGFTAARKEIVDLLRQRSRPYLFSNTVAPVVAAASLRAVELIAGSNDLRRKLGENTALFRREMTAAGFQIRPGVHPIVPVMLGDAKLAGQMAERMLAEGIYVIGFSYPVVPQGAARIRVQLSAAHETEHVKRAVAAFVKVGRELGVIK
ncbi:MAG TPA: glycine C-acetyltransferase [Planctomycetota bacterium]|nr:glycine C-acetyltransferase [Planctomycetota bacterium]